jgi:hypothetical protein
MAQEGKENLFGFGGRLWRPAGRGKYEDPAGRVWLARFRRPIRPGVDVVLLLRDVDQRHEYAVAYTVRPGWG